MDRLPFFFFQRKPNQKLTTFGLTHFFIALHDEIELIRGKQKTKLSSVLVTFPSQRLSGKSSSMLTSSFIHLVCRLEDVLLYRISSFHPPTPAGTLRPLKGFFFPLIWAVEQEKGRNIETAHSAPCTWRHNVFGFYDGCFHPLSDKCEQGQAKMLSFPRKLCCVTVISGVRDAARVTALANDSIRSRWVILAPIFFLRRK